MFRIPRRGPGTAASLSLVFVLTLVLTLSGTSPARATPVDLIHNLPAGWSLATTGSGGLAWYCSTAATDCPKAFDQDDSTFSYHSHDGGDGCAHVNPWHSFNASECFWNARVSRSSGVTSFVIGAYRILYDTVGTCCGGPNVHGFEVKVGPEGAGTAQTCATILTSASSGELLGSCDSDVTVVDGDHIQVSSFADWNGGTRMRIKSFEVYASLVTEVGIETYMVNMHVGHPNFQWNTGWTWAIDWNGTLSFSTSPSGTFYTVDHPSTARSGSYDETSYSAHLGNTFLDYWHQDCFPLCQSDHVTVTITDTDRDQTASVTFDRSSDGYVSAPTRVPRFVYFKPCYNATLDQCPTIGGAAGSLALAWKWTGTVSHFELFQGDPSTGIRAYNDDGETEGAYAVTDLPVDESGTIHWTVKLTNAAGQVTVGTFDLDYGTGGPQPGYEDPNAPENGGGGSVVCGEAEVPVIGGVVCAIKEVFSISSAWLVETISDRLDDLKEAAYARQPFNFIARAGSGITGQISRAQAELSDTDDCPGITVTLPLPSTVYAGGNSYPAFPSARPSFVINGTNYGGGAPSFSFLKCADFEPIVTSSWYGPIRTAMDPALYLLYAVAWLKKLQPKPVVAG